MQLSINKIVYISFVVAYLIHISLYALSIELPKYVENLFDIIRMITSVTFWYGCFSFYIENDFQQLLLKYSKYNFPICCFHGLVPGFLQRLTLKVLPSTPFMLLISYVALPLTIAAGIIIFSYIFNKCFPKVFSFIMGSRF